MGARTNKRKTVVAKQVNDRGKKFQYTPCRRPVNPRQLVSHMKRRYMYQNNIII